MSVWDVCCFNDGARFGYLALMDSFENGKRNAVKLFGNMFGNNFKFVDVDYFKELNIKTLRKPEKFARYIKSVYPSIMINPINKNGVVFDLPIIYLDNIAYARWEPIFEDSVNSNSFRLISDGAIVEYSYKQPIFISVLDMKRHVSKSNEERLLVNITNGLITRLVKQASATSYIEAQYHVGMGNWICDSYNEIPIAGYKMR